MTTKPAGMWKCWACGKSWSGEQLYQDLQATLETWTCNDLSCGGACYPLQSQTLTARAKVVADENKNAEPASG